ncbi:MAG: hypothetical protein HYZ49_11605 [Chloroflexi bacterium]|nr:hypothetical protein [Chloroflexota bacterium]
MTHSIGMAAQNDSERLKFENEVKRIVDAGNAAGLTLRLLGSLAFHQHCPNYGHLQARMGRAYTDIDFAGYGKQAAQIRKWMPAALGYKEDTEVFINSEGARMIFEHPGNGLHVDIFVDKLDFCHTIFWNGRLEKDSPTIPLAEMVLEKLQIVKINEKDIIDMIMLLLEHPWGGHDAETINLPYITKICADDWGFWRTVTMNLDKVKRLAQAYTTLSDDEKNKVASQVDHALNALNAAPKSFGWKMRDKIGDKVKWYKDVEEVK